MLSNITQSYDLTDATFEILFMLFIIFLLGYLLAWLIHKPRGISSSVVGGTTQRKVDNLKIIEGIGPKIESILNDAGILSYEEVIEADIEWLQKILDAAGPKYQMHNPKTWPDQAELAMSGSWSELKEYQDLLNSGKDS